MVFSSHIFIYYFLPFTLLVYYLLPKQRNLFLLLVSYVFYGWANPQYALLMLFATVVNFQCGKIIGAPAASDRTRKRGVAISIIVSLSLLGFFKYFTFANANLIALFGALGLPEPALIQIVLPAGISFYSFHSMSYTIDVYRGDAPPARNFVDFACYLAFFPQLIAGPIIRYHTIGHQFVSREHTLARFSSGVAIFSLGLSKKVLLANSIGSAATAAFEADSPGVAAAWFGILAYAFQIYYDFSAYSEMAMGLGRMFGFEFPRNFNAPYLSESITDFWRRWHISLSTFLRDYLYIPLGGNRLGPWRTYVNLATVMVFGGLWHGANWTFVVWGAYHGVLLALERSTGKTSIYAGLPRALRIAITFVLVLFSWVLFRSPDISFAFSYFAALFGANGWEGANPLLHALLFTPTHLIVMAICVGLTWQPVQALDLAEETPMPRTLVVTSLLVLSLVVMSVQSFNPFLYFQF